MNQVTTEELRGYKVKPCPFCGGKANVCELSQSTCVYCSECGARVEEEYISHRGRSVAAWNKRSAK